MINYFFYIIAFAISFLVYLWTKNLYISIVFLILILLLGHIYNPKRRYIRAFWSCLGLATISNIVEFRISGELSSIQFDFMNFNEWYLTLSLLAIAGLSLFLDFKSRNDQNYNHSADKNTQIQIFGNNNNQKIESDGK